MKRTIIAVISIGLILFAFSACRPTVVGIPVDPTPSTPVTPSDPSIPDNKVVIGDTTYDTLEEAIAAAPANSVITLGEGTYTLLAPITLVDGVSINGSGMDKSVIRANGNAIVVRGEESTISNLTIADVETTFETGTPTFIISIESSKIKIDSIKITGNYSSSVEGSVQHYGIVTGSSTSDITITNSSFTGVRIPLELDADDVPSFKINISNNKFDVFEKLTIDYSEGSVITGNVFEKDVNDSFQIDLDKNGTPEIAASIAASNDCIVQIHDTSLSYDKDGLLVSSEDILNKLAAGGVGTKAKLTDSFEITKAITFAAEASGITLNGNEQTITVNIAGATQLNAAEAFHVNGNNVVFNNVDITVASDYINVIIPYAVGFIYDGGTITGTIDNDSWSVNMGINPAAGSKGTIIRNASFIETYTPVYAESADFRLENVGFSSGIEIVNYSDETELVDCYPIDGTYMTSFNIHDDIPYTEAMEISRQNNNCIVIPDRNGTQIKYNSEGMVITTPENLKAAFDKSLSVDETINATIIAPITVESSFIAQQGSSNLHITASGEGGIAISSPINLTSVTGLAFKDVSFTVGSNTNQAFIINTGSDVAFSGCTFTKEGDSPSGVAISVNGHAGNIKVTDCVFNNFVTTIYSDLNRGEITGNTINGYGGIYILSNNNIANNAEAMNYPDLKVSGNIAGYDISSYDSESTGDDRFDNTLRFAVTDATTALSDAVKSFAADLKTANPDMNVAVIYEGEYPNIPVLWANNEDYSQGE